MNAILERISTACAMFWAALWFRVPGQPGYYPPDRQACLECTCKHLSAALVASKSGKHGNGHPRMVRPKDTERLEALMHLCQALVIGTEVKGAYASFSGYATGHIVVAEDCFARINAPGALEKLREVRKYGPVAGEGQAALERAVLDLYPAAVREDLWALGHALEAIAELPDCLGWARAPYTGIVTGYACGCTSLKGWRNATGYVLAIARAELMSVMADLISLDKPTEPSAL